MHAADLILKVQRVQVASMELKRLMKEEPERELTEEELDRFRSDFDGFDLEKTANEMIGAELVAEWFARGLKFPTFSKVFWYVFSIYEGTTKAGERPVDPTVGDDQGEAPAPEMGATESPMSSPSGNSSRPTSTVSTG